MKAKLSPFFRIQLISLVYGIASNLVHPVTPTMIMELALPEYMTGVLFAAMALGCFLFSAFWGRMADRRGRKPMLAITFLGYALAQLGFGYATSPALLMLCRFVGGSFTGGTAVVMMALVIDASSAESRARRLSYYAAMIGASSSLGFFVGGLLGMVSLKLTFWVQFFGLCLGALLSMLWTPEPTFTEIHATPKLDLRLLRSMLPLSTMLFLMSVMLANFGTFGFDNALANYLRFALNYPPSVNGVVKAVSGLLGLVVNAFVNPWLLRRMQAGRALILSLALCAITLLLVGAVPWVVMFMASSIAFYVFNAMYIPIQQALTGQDKQVDFGLMSGMFYTVRSLGMIAGSLSAGFLYVANAKLPFWVQAIGFALAALAAWLSIRSRRKSELQENGVQV